MENTLNIIEIIDGKYNLNAQQLQSALALAEGCDSIALISIVGPKNSGKTFLIKCLLSYMKSENKDEWPQKEDGVIEIDYRLTDEDNDRKSVIKLTQNPYIMRDEEWITAVFLIDTDFVFDLEMSSKQENDILGLLLLTSSTVIYNYKRYLPVPQFRRLENTITALSNIDSSMSSMKNIMFLIRDWSPEDHNNEFRFGLYDGSLYLNHFLKHINLNDKYAGLNCCLMSAPNHDKHSEDINLSELCPQFLKDVKTLIGCKLINFDEMQLKRKFNSSELLKLFEDYVQTLNENSLNTNLIDVNQKLKPEDSLRYETEISKSTANTESNDTKSMINHKMNETLESRKYELNNKHIINNKMKRSEEQNKRRGINFNNFNFDSINSTTTQTDSESNPNSSIVFIENDKTLKEGEEREVTNKYNNEDTQPDLIDLTVDADDDIVACSAFTGSLNLKPEDSLRYEKEVSKRTANTEYNDINTIINHKNDERIT